MFWVCDPPKTVALALLRGYGFSVKSDIKFLLSHIVSFVVVVIFKVPKVNVSSI